MVGHRGRDRSCPVVSAPGVVVGASVGLGEGPAGPSSRWRDTHRRDRRRVVAQRLGLHDAEDSGAASPRGEREDRLRGRRGPVAVDRGRARDASAMPGGGLAGRRSTAGLRRAGSRSGRRVRRAPPCASLRHRPWPDAWSRWRAAVSASAAAPLGPRRPDVGPASAPAGRSNSVPHLGRRRRGSIGQIGLRGIPAKIASTGSRLLVQGRPASRPRLGGRPWPSRPRR